MPIHGYPGNIVTANPTAPTVDSASGVWTTEQALQNLANWPMPLQQISRSLRFNSADSAYLNRTPASAGNRKTWTWSGWVKPTGITSATGENLFATENGAATNTGQLFFNGSSRILELNSYASSAYQWRLITTQVFRDPSAWYHIVAVLDTTQATSSNRVKLYVNGVQVTAFTTATYPSQNADGTYNLNEPHYIGAQNASSGRFNGYLTEINFIDGLALDPSYFGFFDANGIWQPRAYKGAYGTNGFYLNFSDNSSTTNLGLDYSGNSNNWTPNNFSVTAGAGNDSLVDTPTPYGTDTGAGGEVRGNYATWNPLSFRGTAATLSNGNLDSVTPDPTGFQFATINFPTSGKWYYEQKVISGANPFIGVGNQSAANAFTSSLLYYVDGNKYVNNVNSAYGASYTTNDVIGVAVNCDTNEVTFYKNGVSQGAISYTVNTGNFAPGLTDGASGSGVTYENNFGQRPFAYTAPSGFKALCTQNLPEPTIADGGDYFNTVLYTGTGSSLAVTGVGFQPDFVWGKSRSNAFSHVLGDVVRGNSKALFSNLTNAEDDSPGLYVASFDADGFTTNGTGLNTSGATYVAWNWKANGAGVSNTDGTITSTVSVNTTSGFSIVTYTGNGTVGATVGHGLGVAPSLIFFKRRNSAVEWNVYSSALGNGQFLVLNSTQAAGSSSWLNNTTPSSTVFTLSNLSGTNESGGTYVAYCFAAIPGYSAFGSYTGNGSTDGPFVYTGFRPAFVMVKQTSASGNSWPMFDTAVNPANYSALSNLFANLSDAEAPNNFGFDILSNGFKVRATSTNLNGSGNVYIYMAFAENPFKYSRAR